MKILDSGFFENWINWMLFRSREKIFNHMMNREKWTRHMFGLPQYWKKLSYWDNLYFYSVRAERILSKWGLGPFFPKICIPELNFKWGSGLQSLLVPPSLFYSISMKWLIFLTMVGDQCGVLSTSFLMWSFLLRILRTVDSFIPLSRAMVACLIPRGVGTV